MASKALRQASPRRLKPLYLDRLCALLEETARRRLDALPLEAVVAQLAALEAGERLVPGEAAPAPEVAECIVQMDAAKLRELRQRLRERLTPASAED